MKLAKKKRHGPSSPAGEAVPGHMDSVDYTDVLRQGLGEWSPNGKFLAGAQQFLGSLRSPRGMMRDARKKEGHATRPNRWSISIEFLVGGLEHF